MRMMILCYCNGIRTRTFDISRNDQHFLLSMKMIFYFDVVADVESGGIVAEEELQLLNKPNHVSTPEEAENQCGKAGCGQYVAEEFLVHGKIGIVKHDDEDDVLGRTLSGRHLLSSRRYFRRIAWHQVVMWQTKQLNEPTDVKITEWNISHQN
ncbi:unnamed protein product [Brassica napus]|uniref:(rape) hypothetical protein n=1 Tax=Brassica napus TaxID=3708 RepID=A0A816TFV0_BRANA|nr:unnamed protein product [Brassica napus]